MFKRIKRGGRREERISKILFPLFSLIIIGLLLFSDIRIVRRRAGLQKKIESLKTELQALEKKNQQLRNGLSQTGKESYWEEKIRQEGYVRKGEEPVVVLPPEGASKEEIVEKKTLPERASAKMKRIFAGLVEWFNATFPR